MSEAPERIWVEGNAYWDTGVWGLDKEEDADVEYVRADRLEEYDKAFTNLHREYDARGDRIAELEAKLRQSSLKELAALGQAQEAYQAQLEAEAKLAKVTAAYRLEAMKRDDYSHDAFDKHLAELTGGKT